MAIVSKERVEKLQEVVNKYPDILYDFEIEGSIIKTYTFEKPVSSIEIYSKKNKEVEKLIKDFEDFFFVGQIHYNHNHVI